MIKLLTPEELSQILHVKISTIYQWTHMGTIPFVKIGKLIRFKEDDVKEWIDKREIKDKNRYLSDY
ncbi:MAG: helix-turn-helix domain-containing protein [Candidatus Aminicenantes bacterium]|jgi:excisionase family DNA binding protein